MRTPQKVIVLLSGGLDSAVVLADVLAQPLEEVERVHALIFDYGQSNIAEVPKAQALCKQWRVPYTIQEIDPEMFGGKTDTNQEVPARNLVFASLAASFAINMGFDTIATGAEPDSRYTDSTEAFNSALDTVLAQFGMHLITPVKKLPNKTAVVRKALDLGVPLHLCHSSRTNVVDGHCKTSVLFVNALTQLFPFPAYTAVELLRELGRVRHEVNELHNVITIKYDGASVAYPAALFTLMGMPTLHQSEVLTVYSGDAWAPALQAALKRSKHQPNVTVCYRSGCSLLESTMKETINCNNTFVEWGLKQALAVLPRPRYVPTVACSQSRGYLAFALCRLGYKVEMPAYREGLLLETGLSI